METNPLKQFKRLFYKLYFCDMGVQEILELVLCIDSLACRMLNEANRTDKVNELNEDLRIFGNELLELVTET